VRIALIINEGSGAAGEFDISGHLAAAAHEIEQFDIGAAGEIGETGGFDRIVVAGGDGSLGLAAEQAERLETPLAVIPAGTANDFARRMGLPDDLEDATRLAAESSATRRIDIAELGGRSFLNVASLGLAPAAAEAADELKERLGPLAYAIGAVRAGASEEPFASRVICDGEEVFEGDAWQITVGSTGAFGGGSQIEADADDGLLDVVVIEGGPRSALARRAYGLRQGGVEEQAGVHDSRGAKVTVECGPDEALNIDGEVCNAEAVGHDGSERGAIEFGVRPRALELVIE
jgi:diacylglycerol kinase (ATP)